MEKIFIVDKPIGKTSYQIVAEFKKRFPGEKVGHAGTLDPLASGLLIVLVGRGATKQQSKFMNLDKEYLIEASFGVTTETWDLEKKPVIWQSHDLIKELNQLTDTKVKSVLSQFEGKFTQIIPAFSAVKVKGQRLYKKARKGRIEISKLPKREVFLKELVLEDFQASTLKPNDILVAHLILKKGPKAKIRMKVSKGTYVRSVVYQLGEALGVGAVTSFLRRTKVGDFEPKDKPYVI